MVHVAFHDCPTESWLTTGLGACLLPQVVIAGATRAFRPHDEHIIQEYELALDRMRLSPGSKCALGLK
jgi:hypothetical protein